jgi:hypothetical protein
VTPFFGLSAFQTGVSTMTCSRATLRLALLLASLSLASLATHGCGPEGPRLIEGKSLRYAYTGLGYECGTILLRLSDEGTFALACVPADDASCDTLGVRALASVEGALSGTWESRGGDLTLVCTRGPGASDTAIVFTECEVAVSARESQVLLPGLRWVSGTRPTFADSSRLVADDDLREFLRPAAGSGRRTSAL